ncbi:MAG TPA: hypothetical protein VLT62_09710 [Candidatus Methylomirabilis sp.]|nr:hypothetical protein [Candidatus Methylomirabilis sp.]
MPGVQDSIPASAPSRWEAEATAAAEIIRHRSGQGQLATEEDILEELAALKLFEAAPGEGPTALAEILAAAKAASQDLREIQDQGGVPRHYSAQFMTEMYARLLVRKEGDPLQLIAEIVRENSSLYPRPFPLGGFERTPFGMSREEIRHCLDRMAGLEAYQDIARTTTSASNTFLYSTTHLDPDYAATLAEWIDVGQYDNP